MPPIPVVRFVSNTITHLPNIVGKNTCPVMTWSAAGGKNISFSKNVGIMVKRRWLDGASPSF